MGLWDIIRRWMGWTPRQAPPTDRRSPRRAAAPRLPRRATLAFRPRPQQTRGFPAAAVARSVPYKLARPNVTGGYLDLTQDGNDARLQSRRLPLFRTPAEIAGWLGLKLGQLAWLTHRFEPNGKASTAAKAHYHFRWIAKRSGGFRLIESPKRTLRAAQKQILAEILDRVRPHAAAHGFAAGRSICTNAAPHVGQHVVLHLDLQNFYTSVTFARVVAIFRSLGYCREAAIWLARLTTSAVPADVAPPPRTPDHKEILAPYLPRHLPQGAPTSPALANLSAFSLDLRLAGLARSFGGKYTRYADDLAFSGNKPFAAGLPIFLQLVRRILRAERFYENRGKFRVMRRSQRQKVSGVVVNQQLAVARRDYDHLKAILVNCVRRGPSTQNHDRRDDWAEHLRGRIAHIQWIHPRRGERLLELYQQIDWTR